MPTPTFNADGSKAATAAKLDATVFDIAPDNHELLKQVYTAYLSNGRTRNAVTKTRGLVSGGGKKPWRQKGTGRARFGSSRNPIWRGGGIAFGPTGEENFTKHINVKAKRLAIRQALSLAQTENKIVVVESFNPESGKTSAAADFFAKVGAKRRTLVIVDQLNDESVRATNNLQNIALVSAQYVNVYDVMNADTLIITKAGLQILSSWLGGTSTKKAEA